MNNVCLIGNLTHEPELKYTQGENPIAVCRFRIAVNEGYGDRKRTDFLTIVAWRWTAENVDKFCHKGSKVAVTGKIQTGSYEKQDGTKVQTFEINANSVEFLSGKSEQAEQRTEAPMPADVPSGFMQLDSDEGIPF